MAFLMDYAVVDWIIRHIELTFAAERPSPSRIFSQVGLTEVEGFGDSSQRMMSGGAGRSGIAGPALRPSGPIIYSSGAGSTQF